MAVAIQCMNAINYFYCTKDYLKYSNMNRNNLEIGMLFNVILI